jgi:hypothetical protein
MSDIVRDYIELVEGTEVPSMFNVWGGYVVVSACISRRVWYMHGSKPIYPNIYTMLVGDAGNGKSMAINDVRSLLLDIDNIPIANCMETPEGLIRRLAGEQKGDDFVEYRYAIKTVGPSGNECTVSPVTILASEFINFVGKSQDSWINILNDVYDTERQFDYNTKNQGHDIIEGPCFVLFGGLATEISFDMQKNHIIQSGFARRTIFQYGERRFDNPCPFPPGGEEKRLLRESIIQRCRALQQLQGTLVMPQETREFYGEWYNDHSIRLCKSAAPHIRSWYNSKSVQVLKIAMLTSLAESHDLVILPSHIESALNLFEVMEKDLYGIFGGAGRNELANVAVKMLMYLNSQSYAVALRTLENHFFQDCKLPADFNTCLHHLISKGEVVTHDVSVNGAAVKYVGRPEVMIAFITANQPLPPEDSAAA